MKIFPNWFEWDERSLTFQRASIAWRAYWRQLPRWITFQVFVGLGLMLLTRGGWERYFIRQAEAELHRLEEQEKQILSQITAAETALERLYAQAQRLYRPVLGLPSLPSSHWEGHTGGCSAQSLGKALVPGPPRAI
ncbi:MAG: hypothetical protein KatS3mg026_1148 [Bacteroidia bacterium]|nr:MAG: hypothetical protein KatS3mg026_1148 [Bacteroidia bacterium]